MDILKSKAWLRRTVWSVLAVLVLWALGWLALPPLLRSQGQKLASEALGRDVRIGRIEFVPWSLQLTVHDVAVATADGQGAQFTVTRAPTGTCRMGEAFPGHDAGLILARILAAGPAVVRTGEHHITLVAGSDEVTLESEASVLNPPPLPPPPLPLPPGVPPPPPPPLR